MKTQTTWINRPTLTIIFACALAALGTSAYAQDDQPTQTRTLEHTAVIEAPVAEVWKTFIDPEKMQQWMAPKVDIDLRVGGLIRTNYNPAGTFDDATSIHNRILAYENERMLSMQNVKAPANFPIGETLQQTWSVIYFEPLGAYLTRIRMVGLGWGTGEQWDATFNYFKAANQGLLDELSRMLESQYGIDEGDGVDDSGRASFDVFSKWSVGTWKYEGEGPGSGPFVAESRIETAGDGKSLVTRGWLTVNGERFQHGDTLIFLDPSTQQIRYVNVNEQGHVAEGFIHRAGEKAFFWDWNATAADGSSSIRYKITTTFLNDDSYRMVLRPADASADAPPMVDIVFERQ